MSEESSIPGVLALLVLGIAVWALSVVRCDGNMEFPDGQNPETVISSPRQ